MKSKIQKAIEYGAKKRMEFNGVIWPDKGTPQYYEMRGFENAIVWYQQYLKTLLK